MVQYTKQYGRQFGSFHSCHQRDTSTVQLLYSTGKSENPVFLDTCNGSLTQSILSLAPGTSNYERSLLTDGAVATRRLGIAQLVDRPTMSMRSDSLYRR
jgi:hypothetical protein